MSSSNYSTRNNVLRAFTRAVRAAVRKDKSAPTVVCAAIECTSGRQINNPHLSTRIPPLEINPDI